MHELTSPPPPVLGAPLRLADLLGDLGPTASVRTGPLDPAPFARRSAFAIVVAGAILRRTESGGRDAAELLGPGDVLDLRGDHDPSTLRSVMTFEVLVDAALAPVPPPGTPVGDAVLRALPHQLADQCRRASIHLAALSQPHVEERLRAVLCEVADRFGRVARDGVVVDLPLTHRLLGALVGARRPTVSLAIAALTERGELARRDDGAWLVSRTARLGA